MSFTNNVQLLEMSKKQSTNKRGKWQVILHNDDVNTFDYVIDCLMQTCGHSYIQSAQCAHLVHTKLQCSIFVDSYEECESVFEELQSHQLTVSISKYKKL